MKHYSKYQKLYQTFNNNQKKINLLFDLKSSLLLELKDKINKQLNLIAKKHIKEEFFVESTNNEIKILVNSLLENGNFEKTIFLKITLKRPIPTNTHPLPPIEDLFINLNVNPLLTQKEDSERLISLGKISSFIFNNKIKILNNLNSIFIQYKEKIDTKCSKNIKKTLLVNNKLRYQITTLMLEMTKEALQNSPLTLNVLLNYQLKSNQKTIPFNELKITSITPLTTTYELTDSLNNTPPKTYTITIPSSDTTILEDLILKFHSIFPEKREEYLKNY